MPDTPKTLEQEIERVHSLELVCACVAGFAFSANYAKHAPLVPPLTQAFGFSLALAGFLTIGVGCGCPYPALFTSAAALYPGRACAAMGLVNMLGIIMIPAAPPVIDRLVNWSGCFQSSFPALSGFSLLALESTLGIRES